MSRQYPIWPHRIPTKKVLAKNKMSESRNKTALLDMEDSKAPKSMFGRLQSPMSKAYTGPIQSKLVSGVSGCVATRIFAGKQVNAKNISANPKYKNQREPIMILDTLLMDSIIYIAFLQPPRLCKPYPNLEEVTRPICLFKSYNPAEGKSLYV